jgi:hypothetical protein
MYSPLCFAFAQVFFQIALLSAWNLQFWVSWLISNPILCRLWLSFLTCSHRLWYTLRYSILWVPLFGLLIGLSGTYSSCILLCYILPSMGWWLLLSLQIITLLPSLLLHVICCGTFSVVLWFLIRYGNWCFIASISSFSCSQLSKSHCYRKW